MLDDDGPTGKIAIECLNKVARCSFLQLVIRNVHHNLEGAVAGHLSCPTYDVILGLISEVSIPKWKRIKGVKQLRDVVHTNFDQVFRGLRRSLTFPYHRMLPCIARCHSIWTG